MPLGAHCSQILLQQKHKYPSLLIVQCCHPVKSSAVYSMLSLLCVCDKCCVVLCNTTSCAECKGSHPKPLTFVVLNPSHCDWLCVCALKV